MNFGGYTLAYGFHLYTQHSIEPDTLCQLVLLQQGETQTFGFIHDTLRESFYKAREYLHDIDEVESYDAAAIVVDVRTGLNGYRGVDDVLMLSMFTPDASAGRYIRSPYQRVRGEVMPISPPALIGAWSEREMQMGVRWVLQGMRDFHQDHNTAM
jgi:hypothetical protein